MTNLQSLERCVALLARTCLERNEKKAAVLAQEYGRAVSEAAREHWGKRLDAARALLDQAELELDRAQEAKRHGDLARCRQHLAAFELMLGAARADV